VLDGQVGAGIRGMKKGIQMMQRKSFKIRKRNRGHGLKVERAWGRTLQEGWEGGGLCIGKGGAFK